MNTYPTTVYVLHNYNEGKVIGVFDNKTAAEIRHQELDDEWMGSAPRGLESPLPLAIDVFILQS